MPNDLNSILAIGQPTEAELHYPRPGLRRDRWTDLCGAWEFGFDDENLGVCERWFASSPPAGVFDRLIIVPFPPESRASGVHDTAFHPVVWYRRTFTVEDADRSERLVLHFGAVDYRAQVWVNGSMVASHEGGHTPFSAEIASVLVDGPAQVVVVRAEDQPTDLRQPRGKQFWREELRHIWYHRTTGIWQPVWLEPVPITAFEEVRWTPNLDHFGVEMVVRLNHDAPEGARLHVRMIGTGTDSGLTIPTPWRDELRRLVLFNRDRQMGAGRLLYWSPTTPHLINVELTLSAADGTVLDRVDSYFGLRSVEVRDRRVPFERRADLHAPCASAELLAETLLAAPSVEALREEVLLAKSMGFNGVRIHQKIEDPRFLYWCDRLGMMVWAKQPTPMFDDQAAERLTREWLEAVRRDYNHPSLIAGCL